MSDEIFDVAMKKLLYGIAGYDENRTVPDEKTDVDVAREAVGRVNNLEAENEELRELVENQQTQLQVISDLASDNSSKNEKVAALVVYADNTRNGQGVVKLDVRDIMGATGVSRRYAYDLMDRLPGEHEWCHSGEDLRQYGDMEIDKSSQQRTLAIDFDGSHGDACPVNKFTTQFTQNTVSA